MGGSHLLQRLLRLLHPLGLHLLDCRLLLPLPPELHNPGRHRFLMLNNLCLTFRRNSIRYHIRKQLSSQRCSSPCLTFGRSTKGCRAILPLETLMLRSDFYLVYMRGFTTAPSPTSRTCYCGQVSRQTFCHWRRKRSWDAPYVGIMSGYRTGLS